MDPTKARTESEAIAQLARDLSQVQEIKLDGVDDSEVLVLAVPNGKQVVPVKTFLDAYRTEPERRKGTAKLTTIDSFISHANRFKDGHSALFADPDQSNPKLVGVLNYHRKGAEAPRFGDHRGVYEFPLSDEWKAWTATDGRQFDIAGFATFVEDRIADVLSPAAVGESGKEFASQHGCALASPQKLMELSRGLTVRVGAKVAEHRSLSTGEGQVQFTTEHSDENGKPLQVPGAFVIGIPVFRGGARYQVPVRLRYRVGNGSISWTLALYRTDVVFDAAFTEACLRAQKETELPLFYGTPES